MFKVTKAVLIVGSPKGFKSTSFSLGNYLLETLGEKGLDTRVIILESRVVSPPDQEALLADINSCELLILAVPLYVDSLPADVIKLMEILRDKRLADKERKETLLCPIVNSGFPEAVQSKTALAIFKQFAMETGFQWTGGLALGGGGAIEGKPLKSMGGMARNITKSLDKAGQALAEGRNIPQEAVDLMAKPIVLKWMLSVFGVFMWRYWARKYGTHKRLTERPYEC